MAMPAMAQYNSPGDASRESQYQEDRRDQESRQQERQQQDQQWQQDQRQQDRQRQEASRNRQRPEGWIAVAYDYDNDGTYEAADFLYYYDLEEAKQRSQRRKDQQQAHRGSDDRQARRDDGRQSRRLRAQGTITNMGIKGLTLGMDDRSDRDYRFAKIEKNSGETCHVMLGTEEKLSQIDLREGDQVTVEGVLARVDGKQVILAERVSTDSNSITNQLPPRQHWRKFTGKIRRLRRTDEGRDTSHTIVELRNNDHRIDLGPERELSDLDLREGDQIAILARQGRVDGEQIMIAQKIRAAGQTIDVREATHRSISRGSRSPAQR